jgi:hypothetical protein
VALDVARLLLRHVLAWVARTTRRTMTVDWLRP